MITQTHISDDQIACRAYEIWQKRGCPAGDGREDWHAAVAELSSARVCRSESTQQRMQSWWSRVREKFAAPPFRN